MSSSHTNHEESEDEEWDKDTDEINSIASDELHETRPNRWKGPPTTWLTFTEQERKAYQAFEGLRRRDLSAHLYNAHALKSRVKRQKTDNAANDEIEDEQVPRRPENDEWAPSHRWTAWPLRTGEVVDDELIPRTEDEHDAFTLRRAVQTYPSQNLEQEISATILRCAKDKFRSRGFPEEDDEDHHPVGEGNDGVVASIETGDNDHHHPTESSQLPSSPPRRRNDESSRYSVPLSSPVKGEPRSQDEGNKQAGPSSQNPNPPRRRRREPTPTYVPGPSIDDERSYKLLRPASRRILSKLDETLTILHNARVAGLRDLSESSASDNEDSDTDADTETARQQKPERKRKGRALARSPSPSAAEATASESKPDKPRSTSKRGRKPKIRVPLEGETEEEMLIRIARETHKKLPSFARSRSRASSRYTTDDDDETASEADSEADVPPKSYQQPSSKKTKRSARDRKDRGRSRSQSVTSTTALTAAQEKDRQERLARWGLRDWRDVLGAAALAGFPQSVVARAAQRCATLFGEEMTFHTLSSTNKTRTTTYRPGDLSLLNASGSEGEEDEAEIELEQRRTVSRQPSLARAFSLDSSSEEDQTMEDANEAASEAGSQRGRAKKAGTPAPSLSLGGGGLRVRRRSVTPVAGDVHFCPYPECERAVEGFARRANMHRHLKLVHGRSPPPLTTTTTTASSPAGSVVGDNDLDQDSMDEMEGGVHLDGFLQPIKVRKGWRGGDVVQREREAGGKYNGRGSRGRRGLVSSAGSDVDMNLGDDGGEGDM
ncbi:hypothetical protein B0T20DRAFT_110415 [Sordaria brevicollis]|uniref:Rrn9 domain-containing protein n=1 Tax=Sordaria brevicollis TaxID=83679 RepID=A0AAE0NUT9_SORBR|nr:hypothetical protein B0T20DRAFT_110415 [Sordaria brevicollis]